MFVNVKEVEDITGREVSREDILRAQHVIEAFVGRNETEVSGADDFALMAKAVAYQAVYMQNNYDKVYEQAAVKQIGQLDAQMTLDTDMASPYIAPMAVLTLRNLTWRRSRSVRTGPIFPTGPRVSRWDTR